MNNVGMPAEPTTCELTTTPLIDAEKVAAFDAVVTLTAIGLLVVL